MSRHRLCVVQLVILYRKHYEMRLFIVLKSPLLRITLTGGFYRVPSNKTLLTQAWPVPFFGSPTRKTLSLSSWNWNPSSLNGTLWGTCKPSFFPYSGSITAPFFIKKPSIVKQQKSRSFVRGFFFLLPVFPFPRTTRANECAWCARRRTQKDWGQCLIPLALSLIHI